jgi:hypothetical protein
VVEGHADLPDPDAHPYSVHTCAPDLLRYLDETTYASTFNSVPTKTTCVCQNKRTRLVVEEGEDATVGHEFVDEQLLVALSGTTLGWRRRPSTAMWQHEFNEDIHRLIVFLFFLN